MEIIQLDNKHTIERTVCHDYVEDREYDEKGNIVRFRDSRGMEAFFDTDESGYLSHAKMIKEGKIVEAWYERNKNGKITHYHNSDGIEYFNEYDEKGNKIHTKHIYTTTLDEWWEYDYEGKLIYFHDSNGLTTQ